jgi:hypothetical protein
VEYVDYWETYSPVVSWNTVCLLIVLSLPNDWHMQSIDFVLAYPQAPIKTDIFMKPPQVPTDFKIPDMPSKADRFIRVYKLLKNLYGLKDGGKTWMTTSSPVYSNGDGNNRKWTNVSSPNRESSSPSTLTMPY